MTTNKIKYMISLLVLILLIPLGMSNTFAQSGPGEEDFADEIGYVGVVNEDVDIQEQCDKQIEDAIIISNDEMESKFIEMYELSKTSGDVENKPTKVYDNKTYDYQSVTYGGTIDEINCTVTSSGVAVSYKSELDPDHDLIELLDVDFNHVNVTLEEKRDFTHVSKNLYNWAGYSIWEGTESSSRINEAKSYSTVPSISQPTGSNAPTCSITNHEECVVSNWVGLSKDWNGYDLMFQGGVDAYCDNSSCNSPTGTSSTFAFWEVIDNNNRVAGSNTSCDSFLTNLYQGDSIRMTVKYKPSNDRYYMTIQDVVSNQYCAANYSSIVEPRYAQYIVESPTNGYNNELYSLSKFNTMTIQGLYKDDSGNRYGLDDAVSNDKYYKITMTHDGTSSGTVKVVPSSVDSKDKFTATWQSSRDAP